MDVSIIAKGGIVMFILIALSVYALAIIFYKIQQFISSGVFDSGYIDKVMAPIKRGELIDATAMLAREKGPVARVMRVSLECVQNRKISMKSANRRLAALVHKKFAISNRICVGWKQWRRQRRCWVCSVR